jgi:hypothetical protein
MRLCASVLYKLYTSICSKEEAIIIQNGTASLSVAGMTDYQAIDQIDVQLKASKNIEPSLFSKKRREMFVAAKACQLLGLDRQAPKQKARQAWIR